MSNEGHFSPLIGAPGSVGAACHGVQHGCGPNLGFLNFPFPCRPTSRRAGGPYLEPRALRADAGSRPDYPGRPGDGAGPPSDDEVMRALEKARPVQGGLPCLYEVQRNNVRMVVEPIADYIDPPRVYPLVGPAQLHHAHYKCIVYYTEVTRVGWPIPYTTTRRMPGGALHRPRPSPHGRERRTRAPAAAIEPKRGGGFEKLEETPAVAAAGVFSSIESCLDCETVHSHNAPGLQCRGVYPHSARV